MATTAILSSIRKKFSSINPENNFVIVAQARKGVKPVLFYEFSHSINMPEKKLATLLNLSSRTISNYNVQHKPLEPVTGEHLLKLIRLFIKGEEIFGNVIEFNYWLQKPFWNNKEKPMDWLVTPGGVDLVADELDRLAHGYAV